MKVHRTRDLPDGDRKRAGAIPVTSGARTIIDLAAHVTFEVLAAVLDDLIAARATTREEVYQRALALGDGRKGAHHLVALTGPDAPGTFRSWLERRTADLLAAAGIISPTWNLEVRDLSGDPWECDAVWVEQRVVVEVDGLRFHDAPSQRRRDNRKDRRLQAAGWRVLRFGWLDVVERPDEVVAEIRAALAA